MKKIFSLTWKVAVVFLTFFIMPAVMASIIMLDINVYMACICHPAYDAVMFFVSLLSTIACVDHLIAIGE